MTNDLVKEDKSSLLASSNFEHSYRIANMMSKSEMVPRAYKDKPQDILIAMEMGVSLGLGPLQAIQNIAVINGKPCLYGDGMLAVCSGHPEFENITEEPIVDDKGKATGYRCTITRRGRTPVSQIFTVEQAQAAGLWGKAGPWKQYPERMLQMRARAFALRDSFADALGGVRMAEEVQDYEIKDITPEKSRINNLSALIAGKAQPKLPEPQQTTPSESDHVDKETGEVLEEKKI